MLVHHRHSAFIRH